MFSGRATHEGKTKAVNRTCSVKNVVLKKLSIYTRKRLCWNLVLIILQGYRCFPVNIPMRGSNKHVAAIMKLN